MRRSSGFGGSVLLGLVASCAPKDVDVSGREPGDACDARAVAGEDEEACADGYVCAPVGDGETSACAAPLRMRGMVFDALTTEPIADARVAALDESGAPVANVAITDAMGLYELEVPALRDAEGVVASSVRWTLFVTAADYQPFPAGLRPALPVDASETTEEQDDEHDTPFFVVENASTSVGLIPIPGAAGVTVSGHVDAVDPDDDAIVLGGGTLVVAEGVGTAAPYAIADAAGDFTLFNVPSGAATIRGYRIGIDLVPAEVAVEALDIEDVVLTSGRVGIAELSEVSGSVNIVNAPGGSLTSVVLIPISVFDLTFERGPVPFGLRAPTPPGAPDVSGGFAIAGVPTGTYKVLAAFENDGLVRDPDPAIAGTAIQEITVTAGTPVTLDASFKITESLQVIGPGADSPEAVTGTPTLSWVDDSSEAYYELTVRDALGTAVWEDLMVVADAGDVEVEYGGPALTPGMYYQFRATSIRDTPQGQFPISRTEDLRGVFFVPGSMPE